MSNQQQTNSENHCQPKPNEQGPIVIQGHLKIYDPVTSEVYVNNRA